MEMIENRTFDEIKLGDTASLVRTLSREDIDLFAIMSGDVNPAHVDEDYAKSDLFHTIIGHGMWGASLISTSLLVRPHPVTNFWHVFEVCSHVGVVLSEQIIALGDQCRREFSHTCCTPHRLDAELIAAHPIEHDHIEGRRRRSLFIKTTYMEAVGIRTTMDHGVNGPRITME